MIGSQGLKVIMIQVKTWNNQMLVQLVKHRSFLS